MLERISTEEVKYYGTYLIRLLDNDCILLYKAKLWGENQRSILNKIHKHEKCFEFLNPVIISMEKLDG
jgi:hypothetical protein